MNTETLKEQIKRELPGWLREDPEFRAYILELTRHDYADRVQTQDRFYDLLGELRRDREAQTLKWEQNQAALERLRQEQAEKWAEQNRRWDENQAALKRLSDEHASKWEQNQAELKHLSDEHASKWEQNQAELKHLSDEHASKWEQNQAELKRLSDGHALRWEQNQLELQRLREEHASKWEQNQTELKRLHEEIMTQAQKHERGIGALGSRWGLQSEKAFRDALAGILERNFGVRVINVTEYDDAGEVFGRPDQVELDVIIKNGLLLICELKSSIDKAGMYIFERKARFYERHHDRKANRLIVISPMIDARARKVAERLGIETFGDSIEVEEL